MQRNGQPEMKTIEITRNGKLFCRAGVTNALVLTVNLHGSVQGESPASLSVCGMCDLGGHRTAHVYWCGELDVRNDEVIDFSFVETADVTVPQDIIPTDSPEYIEEQRRFADLERTFVPDQAPALRKYPNLHFDFQINKEPVTAAAFKGAEEHILCAMDWDKWRPDYCRLSIQSFGDRSQLQDIKGTDWVRRDLSLGDKIIVRVVA